MRTSKIAKMTFLNRLNLPKFSFTENQRCSKIIKFQQSQALTLHFESFWTIVHRFQKGENLYDMKSYGSSDVHHCSKVIYSQRKPLWFGKYEKCHTERWFIHLTNLNNTTFLALNCKCTYIASIQFILKFSLFEEQAHFCIMHC